ncbi:ribonuclease H-like domain-containing protein, partial [Tanacetum coccineum]
PIRSSLVSKETLPDVKDAFAIISREESHRGIASSSSSSVSKPQIMKLMSLINEAPFGSVHANMAGNHSAMFCTSKSLWDTRLGHPSDQAVDVLQNELNITKDSKVSPCGICHKAKKTREPFPISDHQTTCIGEIVHLDMWGPYKV